MSEDPYLPRYKDQVASVAAERRPPANRDPDGKLPAAHDATSAIGESSGKAATRAEKEEPPPANNNDVHDRASSAADDRPSPLSASVTHIPFAFVVDHAADNPSGNSNENNMGFTANGNNSNNTSSEPPTPIQSNHDHNNKSYPWKTAIASLMLIAIAAAVVGGVCGSGGCGGTSADTDNAGHPIPTPAPTSTSTRAQDITNFINLKTYMGFNLSPNGMSPEELALQWLINDDPLQLNAGDEVDEFRLLQRYTLLTLWFQKGTGTAWDDSTNWLTPNECSWYGICCQLGVVTEVDFYQDELQVANGLGGSLSPDLGVLTDLEYLDVDNNTLTGSLPSEIGLWTNLNNFYVSNNTLTGSLPSEIGLWTNLTEIYVTSNFLTGSLPSEIWFVDKFGVVSSL